MAGTNGWDEYKNLVISQLKGLMDEAKEQNRLSNDIDKRLYLIEDNLTKVEMLLHTEYKQKFESYDALKWKVIGACSAIAIIIPLALKLIFKI
jgi:hypothetical protein